MREVKTESCGKTFSRRSQSIHFTLEQHGGDDSKPDGIWNPKRLGVDFEFSFHIVSFRCPWHAMPHIYNDTNPLVVRQEVHTIASNKTNKATHNSNVILVKPKRRFLRLKQRNIHKKEQHAQCHLQQQ